MSGSDLAPSNRHRFVLAERLHDGIRELGGEVDGIAIEFPVHGTMIAALRNGMHRFERWSPVTMICA